MGERFLGGVPLVGQAFYQKLDEVNNTFGHDWGTLKWVKTEKIEFGSELWFQGEKYLKIPKNSKIICDFAIFRSFSLSTIDPL